MHEKADDSFLRTVAPLQGALRVHCYRMLGSSHDSDDVLQEVLLRAWRAKESLSDPAMLRPWLYRIATNACLDELKRRPKRGLASDLHPAAEDPLGPIAPSIEEPVWLEPLPDGWIAAAREVNPSARYAIKESVALAFVAALHALSATQRATLLLRDVVGFSAEETAEALGVTVSAANSALFRARAAVDEKIGGRDPVAIAEAAKDVDEALLARYVRAWEEVDVDALVSLMRDDVQTTMPPSPTWIAGRAANAVFYRHMFALRRLQGLRIVRTGANGQPAFAYYRRSAEGEPFVLRALQVVEVRGGAIARIDHFLTPAVFPVFGLAAELDPARPSVVT
jgi:RNA polymerase sigma-70 factor (TIGR02960 family)